MTRKNTTLSRLRHQLRKKRESLADQFDFKMYMVFHFKDQPQVRTWPNEWLARLLYELCIRDTSLTTAGGRLKQGAHGVL